VRPDRGPQAGRASSASSVDVRARCPRDGQVAVQVIGREIEMSSRSGGVGIVGVIIIVLVILWLVGVIKL